VPDLRPLYDRCRLFVAPLRYGAGMKGKVGEAAAHGLPVVTTSVGAEGMDLVNGRDVLVGDDAESFAAAVAAAYNDRHLWDRVAVNGRRAVQERLSPERVATDLARVFVSRGLAVEQS